MTRSLAMALVGAVWLAGAADAEPVSPAPAAAPGQVPGVDAAVARIEARVLRFAGTGGVVEAFAAPYEPVPMPDPTPLIAFNRALVADWTDRIAADVEAFTISQADVMARMKRPAGFPAWQPVGAGRDRGVATAASGRHAAAARRGAPAPDPLFAPQAQTAAAPGTSGFFGHR